MSFELWIPSSSTASANSARPATGPRRIWLAALVSPAKALIRLSATGTSPRSPSRCCSPGSSRSLQIRSSACSRIQTAVNPHPEPQLTGESLNEIASDRRHPQPHHRRALPRAPPPLLHLRHDGRSPPRRQPLRIPPHRPAPHRLGPRRRPPRHDHHQILRLHLVPFPRLTPKGRSPCACCTSIPLPLAASPPGWSASSSPASLSPSPSPPSPITCTSPTP